MARRLQTIAVALAALTASPAIAQSFGSGDAGSQLRNQLEQDQRRNQQEPDVQTPGSEDKETIEQIILRRCGETDTTPVNLDAVSIRGITEPQRGFRGPLPAQFETQRHALAELKTHAGLTFGELCKQAVLSEAALRNDGFILSKVLIVRNGKPLIRPPERDTTSTAQAQNSASTPVEHYDLWVVASYLDKISFVPPNANPLSSNEDKQYALQAYVRKMLQPLVGYDPAKVVFNQRDWERQQLLLRSFGNANIQLNLIKGDYLGSTTVIATIDPTPIRANLLLDNNVPAQLGTWRVGASLQSFIPSSQPVMVAAQGYNSFSVPGGFVYGSLQANTPIGNQGWTGQLLWATTGTNSKDLYPGPISGEVTGSSNYWLAEIRYPLLIRNDSQLSLGLKGTVQNSTSDIFFNDVYGYDLSTDRIRALRLALSGYTRTAASSSWFNLELSQGINGLGNSLAANEIPSNALGAPDFTTLRLNFIHDHRLAQNRLGTSATIATLRATAQASHTPLPSPEQLTYGGPEIGRGFNSVYLLGDQGWTASLELGQMFKSRPTVINECQSTPRGQIPAAAAKQRYTFMPFVWYDYGSTSYRTNYLPAATASTYGIGARGSKDCTSTGFELGWGIPATSTLPVTDAGLNNTGINSSIVYFRVSVGF